MSGVPRPDRRRRGAPARRAARAGRALAWLALAAAAVATTSGCRAVDFLNEVSEPGLDIARMEVDLRSELQRDLESRSRSTRSSVASVGRVRCRERSELEATCFARISRPGGRRLRKLVVSVDPNTGTYRWEYVR